MGEQMGNQLAVSAARSMLPSTSCETLKPAKAAEFAELVSPLLTLASPSGMTQEERRGWMHAAFLMLGDVRLADLRDAVPEAAKVADHPSKIVPAIRKAIDARPRYQPISANAVPQPEALPRHDVQAEAERAEVAALMKGLADKWRMNHG